jgi:primosomal protein N' (replication factor Y)
MFAEILLPQKLGRDKPTLTYRIPEGLSQKFSRGNIVDIPLRNTRLRGVITGIHEHEPLYPTKEIFELAEKAPHLKPWQVDLLFWIADYYFCPPYKVLKLFFPTAITGKKKLATWIPDLENYHFSSQNLIATGEQKTAIEKIFTTQKQAILLHGITGSGKTEVYRRIAEKILDSGKQILLLVPEISLTPQTFQNFQQEFGSVIAVLHSQLGTREKEKHWYRIYHGEDKIIIGSRSALFAPFNDLGAIIIDEEHEPSYKQDQAPRYHARDVALKIAELLGIKIIFGSATPSIETYEQATCGNYELIELKKRIQHQEPTSLPEIKIIDLRNEIRKKNFSIFSDELRGKISKKLEQREQTILFLNRRGAASAVLCRECGYVEKCSNCDVAMTYHRNLSVESITMAAQRLICHHCGKIRPVSGTCPKCKSVYIRYIGIGTQRIEEETKKDFPQARILRADRDTVKRHESFQIIFESFKNGQADILIGTQMIGKGLHLPQVNLVGVILADLSLTIPDFRSAERTFQILTQVAGRAGRQGKKGEVIIQTYLPDHYAIKNAALHDYQGFVKQELELRKAFHYPPFTRLVKLTIVDAKPDLCLKKAQLCFKLIQDEIQNAGEKSTTATMYPAFIPKLQNKYRWNILVTGCNPSDVIKKVVEKKPEFIEDQGIRIDVDPISTV